MPTPRPNYNPVQLNPVAGARVSVDAPVEAFGGGQQGVERAAQGLAGQVDQVQREAKRDADQVAVLDADKQLSDLETNLVYDPKTGALAKQGKDSFGLPEQVNRDFTDGANKIQEGLSNDEQRLAFKRMLVQRQTDLSRTVDRHVNDQMRKFDDTTTDGYIANEQNAATANYGDHERVALAVQRQRAAIVDYAQRNGLPSEYIQMKTADATSKTLGNVVVRMMDNGDDMGAKKYFDTNKDLFTGQDQIHLEKALEEGTLRGESQRQSDQIVGKSPTLSDALEHSRQIADPKLRDETTRRVRDYFSQKRAADEEFQQQQFKTAADTIEQNGGDRDKVPAQVWAGLSLSERNAIDDRAKQLKAGIPPVTDWPTYYDMKTLASDPATKDKFLKTNLLTLRPKLADAEFKDLTNTQVELRKGRETDDLKGFRSTQSVVSQGLAAVGIDPTPKEGTPAAKRVADFNRQVEQQLVQIETDTGRKPTAEDRQRAVDNLIVKGTQPGTGIFGFFKTDKYGYEGGPIDVPYENIPKKEVGFITMALKARGIPVTPEVITQYYRQKLSTLTPSEEGQ